jgi:hypothetical protein
MGNVDDTRAAGEIPHRGTYISATRARADPRQG